jgi:hypothetical protein
MVEESPPIIEPCKQMNGGLSISSQTPWIAYGSNATRVLTGYDLPILKTRGTMLPVRSDLCVALVTPELVSVSVQEEKSSFVSNVRQSWLVSSLHPAFLVRGGGRDNPSEAEGKAQDHLKPHLGGDARRALECGVPRIPNVSFLRSPTELVCQPLPEQLVSVDIEGANGQPNIVGVSWDESQAFVFPWSDDVRLWLTELFRTNVPTFHNASFDVAELEEAGVEPPAVWWDTINMAALYDPDQPMNLQTQVLTHVPGSIAWKGLVNHEKGPDFEGGTVRVYRDLWASVWATLGRGVPPRTGTEWYAFYNGLDTAWGLGLANSLRRKLTSQGRFGYYEEVLLPLQKPLLEIGARGMPVDEAKVAEHRAECNRKVADATAILVEVGQEMLSIKQAALQNEIDALVRERDSYKINKVKWERGPELTKLRAKVRSAGFNPDSHPQRAALLYEWYGLPPVKNKGSKGFTTDDTAIAGLINRLERGTIKPKRGVVEEVVPVLQAMVDVKKWATLERTFLQPELR